MLRAAVVAMSLCLVAVGVSHAEPNTTPRTGETKYKCEDVKQTKCTAVKGPGGKTEVKDCKQTTVQKCTAISGPGSAAQ